MSIKQISAFAENKPGKVYELLKSLADAGINLRAINIADTKDFGVIRLIAEDNARAKEILEANTVVADTDVIAVEMADRAGALNGIIKVLADAGINIEYLYSFTSPTKLGTFAVIRVDDTASAEKALAAKGFSLMSDADMV